MTDALILGMDEVGRGALAGPVGVGLCAAPLDTPPPAGLTDSKALSARRREALIPEIHQWAFDVTVGYASADEIDAFGIMAALRIAGERAATEMFRKAPELAVRPIIVDGPRNFLGNGDRCGDDIEARWNGERSDVVTRVKADLHFPVVSAASVAAKVARDQLLDELAVQYPEFTGPFAQGKGYGTRLHEETVAKFGPIPGVHRLTWLKE